MNSEPTDLAKRRFAVFMYEIREEIVWAEEFTGQYVKTVTLSDGTTQRIELTPEARDGAPVIRLTGGNAIGLARIRSGSQVNGNLMIQIVDVDDVRRSTILPSDTSLLSMPEFVPTGFSQGIEIFNDHVTPFGFVKGVLTAHLGMTEQAAKSATLAIHTRGAALLSAPTPEGAHRIADQITMEARRFGYPLLCRPVSIGP
jgi:ATP-dependent Clp protease adapter protein ClpS